MFVSTQIYVQQLHFYIFRLTSLQLRLETSTSHVCSRLLVNAIALRMLVTVIVLYGCFFLVYGLKDLNVTFRIMILASFANTRIYASSVACWHGIIGRETSKRTDHGYHHQSQFAEICKGILLPKLYFVLHKKY